MFILVYMLLILNLNERMSQDWFCSPLSLNLTFKAPFLNWAKTLDYLSAPYSGDLVVIYGDEGINIFKYLVIRLIYGCYYTIFQKMAVQFNIARNRRLFHRFRGIYKYSIFDIVNGTLFCWSWGQLTRGLGCFPWQVTMTHIFIEKANHLFIRVYSW